MRTNHVIAVATILVIGVSVKVFVLGPRAEASLEAPTSGNVNVLQLHRNQHMQKLPVQQVNDMTFVFSRND